MDNEVKKQADEELSQLAKVYNLDLNQIEIVFIDNKKFFKFFDQTNREVKMFEKTDDLSLKQAFTDAQSYVQSAQGTDGIKNAKEIFENMLEKTNKINFL